MLLCALLFVIGRLHRAAARHLPKRGSAGGYSEDQTISQQSTRHRWRIHSPLAASEPRRRQVNPNNVRSVNLADIERLGRVHLKRRASSSPLPGGARQAIRGHAHPWISSGMPLRQSPDRDARWAFCSLYEALEDGVSSNYVCVAFTMATDGVMMTVRTSQQNARAVVGDDQIITTSS